MVLLSRVKFAVSDFKKSLDFYNSLGFRLKSDKTYFSWEDLAVFDTGASELAIFHSHKKPLVDPGRKSVSVSFVVEAVDNFHESLVSKGLEIESPPADNKFGFRTFSVRDPDGYRIEFIQSIF